MKFKVLAINLFFIFFSFAQDKQLSADDKTNNEIMIKVQACLPGNPSGAEKLVMPLLAKSLKNNDEPYIARAYLALGLINYYNTRYYTSIEYYNKALASAYAKKDEEFAADCYSNLGTNYIYLNNFPKAISNINRSMKIYEKHGDSLNYYGTMLSIGFLEGSNKNYKEAERLTLRSLAYFKKEKDNDAIALHYNNLAMFYRDEGKYEKALKYADMTLKLTNDVQNKVKIYYIIADTKYRQGNITASNDALFKALGLVQGSDTRMDAILTQIYYQLATNDLSENKFGKIEEYLDKAKKAGKVSGLSENMDGYYDVKAEYYARTGNYKAYKKNHQEYLDYVERKDRQKSAERYDELKAVYETERKETRIAAQQQELSTKNIQLWGLGIIVFILIAASVLILWYYIRMRRYIRSLYKSTLEEVDTPPFLEIKDDGNDKLGALYNNILSLVEEETLFLQPDLNVSDLSSRLGTNDRYVSQAIKDFSKGNFNSFLNRYRINHAKKLILTEENIPLKAVSTKSGFNNHTTFYRQFKEITGLTPSEFMQMSRK